MKIDEVGEQDSVFVDTEVIDLQGLLPYRFAITDIVSFTFERGADAAGAGGFSDMLAGGGPADQPCAKFAGLQPDAAG